MGQRRGPLIVYKEDNGVTRAFRNLPGVELCHVSRLNLLQLAPGAHLGRFIVWSEGAFNELNAIYGNGERNSSSKSGYNLPRHIMSTSDVARIINSDRVQSVIRPAITSQVVHPKKKNALKNRDMMIALNPYFAETRRREAARRKANRKTQAKKNRSHILKIATRVTQNFESKHNDFKENNLIVQKKKKKKKKKLYLKKKKKKKKKKK